ncbi:nucleoside diphosphate kinase regulator [Bosea sp. (in: a-proteobacteria)]|uniref:nucleoside diphosphate kinase regulator n=1 Tax=Bosea sp. (in: a-proteobacteria) TaxID=1871050 RepID=UPI001AD0AF61|nr:nucleoside diphosphate kinase regulator [Bosea sp. (in: a-proteobacteria)]MBN9436408.1 nucleoside diphosphate kinase regulator [Bosea sp. (in: a-proteobacteria)]
MTPLPQIIITHEDLAILSGLIEKAMASGRYTAATRLADELHRAQVVEAALAPQDCLRLNIGGQYLEERSGAVRDIVLVAGRSSAAVGLVSVLSQVGTALLGLSAGQRIGWLDPRGKPRWLRLLRVDGGISGTAPLA